MFWVLLKWSTLSFPPELWTNLILFSNLDLGWDLQLLIPCRSFSSRIQTQKLSAVSQTLSTVNTAHLHKHMVKSTTVMKKHLLSSFFPLPCLMSLCAEIKHHIFSLFCNPSALRSEHQSLMDIHRTCGKPSLPLAKTLHIHYTLITGICSNAVIYLCLWVYWFSWKWTTG